jgi:hypothetical protein
MEYGMSSNDDRADLRSRKNDATLNRRSILIGATMLAAASMLGVKAPTQVAQAQAVKSPSDFIELSIDHSRKQFEKLTEQTKELAEVAQKVALATVEPLKTGVTKAYGQPT